MEAQALPRISKQDPAAAGLRLPGATDEALARLVARGSERAFTALYHRYHQSLYRYCRSIVSDETDAQDALQSVFAAALVALRRSQRDAPLRPWLYRIAHNESVSLLRRRRSHDEFSEGSGGKTVSAEEGMVGRERVSQLFADLGALPEHQRYALVMRELSGLRYDEIAIAMETPTQTVKQTIFRARRALGEFQEGRDMTCQEICQKVSGQDRRQLRSLRLQAHLRHCASCAAFADAIPARQAEMRAYGPMLPAAAAAGILQQALSAGNASVGLGGSGLALAGAGQAVTGAAGLKVAGIAAIVATATVATPWQQLLPAAPQRVAPHEVTHTGSGSGPAGILLAPPLPNTVPRVSAPPTGSARGRGATGRPRDGGSNARSSAQTGSGAAVQPRTVAAPALAGARLAGPSTSSATPLGVKPAPAANAGGSTSPLLGASSAPSGSAPTSASAGPAGSQPRETPSSAPAATPSGDPKQSSSGATPASSGPSSPTRPAETSVAVSPVPAH